MAERFVMLAEYTGHRSNSIRQLRWSDIDLEGETIRWRAEMDKIGYEHRVAIHSELAAFLRAEQKRVGAIGEAWLFPNHEKPREPMSRDEVQKVLWRALRDAAGIPKGEHFGWHSCRRAFANKYREAPLRDLTDLGGWKGPDTVVKTYQRPDESAQRRALRKLATNA